MSHAVVRFLVATAMAAADAAARAQAMPGMAMPGMTMGQDRPAAATSSTPPRHAPANAPPPPVPGDHYADRAYDPAAMTRARDAMMREQGGETFSMILFNLAEYQAGGGHDGYRWDGEGWIGGDIDRAVVRTEGSGTFREGVDAAEVQLLYSHAIGPYFDLQAGVRHDSRPTPSRTYASVGVEGLAPYMFETEARLFLSTRGVLIGRAEAWYDQRVTQRLILQPRVELNLSARDMKRVGIGSGLTDAELGLRLRYEVVRRLAPYVGVSYDARTGRTADLARACGKDPTTTSFVAGARFWF